VTEQLVPHIPADRISVIHEPSCGAGMIMDVLRRSFRVTGGDIRDGYDFLTDDNHHEAIVGNAPFSALQRHIEHALEHAGFVAMLTRIDFDSAASRRHLFGDNPTFAKKLVLTKRIRWIEGSTGSPSYNHCWMLFDREHQGAPTLAYAP